MPPEAPLLAAPRLIELCFQAAGIRDLARPAVWRCPSTCDRVAWRLAAQEPGPLRAIVGPAPAVAPASTSTWWTMKAALLVRLEGYRTIALPGGVDDEPAPSQACRARRTPEP